MLPVGRRASCARGRRPRSSRATARAASATVTLWLSAVWMPARTSTRDDGVIGVGLALAGEGLDAALAALVDVIDDPGLPLPVGLRQLRLRTDTAASYYFLTSTNIHQ